jgi:hypothetical protein
LKEQLSAVAVGTKDEFAVLQQAIDDYLSSLRQASFAYTVPKDVHLGENFAVAAGVSFDQSLSELKRNIESAGEAVGESIKAAPLMEATLIGSQGLAVSTTGESSTRALATNGAATWAWSVDAKERGPQVLTLSLAVVIATAGNPRHSVGTVRRTVSVLVTPLERAQDFARKNWQWLWATLLVPISGFLFNKWTRRRTPSEPRRPWKLVKSTLSSKR